MLREGALSHFLEGSEHGIKGSKVLFLDDLLEEFLVVPGKVGMTSGDFINVLA